MSEDEGLNAVKDRMWRCWNRVIERRRESGEKNVVRVRKIKELVVWLEFKERLVRKRVEDESS